MHAFIECLNEASFRGRVVLKRFCVILDAVNSPRCRVRDVQDALVVVNSERTDCLAFVDVEDRGGVDGERWPILVLVVDSEAVPVDLGRTALVLRARVADEDVAFVSIDGERVNTIFDGQHLASGQVACDDVIGVDRGAVSVEHPVGEATGFALHHLLSEEGRLFVLLTLDLGLLNLHFRMLGVELAIIVISRTNCGKFALFLFLVDEVVTASAALLSVSIKLPNCAEGL